MEKLTRLGLDWSAAVMLFFRAEIIRVFLLCAILLFCHVVATVLIFTDARADNDILYALTYDGKLLQLNTATGAGTIVRPQLPSGYHHFYSFAFYNGSFHASWGEVPTGSGTCKLLSFGPIAGDELNRGFLIGANTISNCPHALSTTIAGDLHTGGVGAVSKWKLKRIDMGSMTLSGVESPFNFLSGDNGSVHGLAFATANMAFMNNNVRLSATGRGLRMRKLSYANGIWSVVGSWVSSIQVLKLPSNTHGLAISPLDANTMYASSGYSLTAANPVVASSLYRMNIAVNPPTSVLVGEIVGYPGVIGITFGPPLNEVVSPTPGNPPQPNGGGSGSLEPIRQLLFE